MIRSSRRWANSRVVGQPGLPHQRRVGGEARDPRVGGQREDAVEVGAVGEDPRRDLVEHRRPRSNATVARPTITLGGRERRDCAAASARSGARSATRPGALVGAARMLDQRRSGSPRPRPAATSASVSPTIHERARSRPSSRAASSSIPGAGLRQSQAPRAPARPRRGGAGTGAKPSSSTPSRREQLEHALVHRAQLRRASPCPWRPPAGWRRRPARSRPSRERRAARRRRPGSSAHVARTQRRLGQRRVIRVGRRSSLSDAVAVEEARRARGAQRVAIAARASVSQWPCWTASSGWETSACQTTAWKDSTSGVRSSAGGVDQDRHVGELGQRAARGADDAVDRSARPRGPAPSRCTRLTETLCSREPPPTEKTSSASRSDQARDLEPRAERASPSRRRWSAPSARRRCRSARSSRSGRACGSR